MNIKTRNDSTLTLSKNEMRDYEYRVADFIIEHFDTIRVKDLTATSSSKERYEILPEAVPGEWPNASEVLNFVIKNMLDKNNISSYLKSIAFVSWTLYSL